MLLQDHFVRTFYDVVKATHPVIMVNVDVDALCALMILSNCFNMDDVQYTVVYVDSPASFDTRLRSFGDVGKNIILINCYGHLSFEEAELPGQHKFFIIDSRRPFHLDNVFSNHISILTYSKEMTSWNLPKIEQVYMESDSSSDEDDGGEDRELMVQQRIIRNAAKAEWSRKRADIIWDYYARTWYSIPSAVLLLELAHSMNKSNANFAWCAAVALSSQFTDNLISFDQYASICTDHMKQFVLKFGQKQKNCGDLMNITFDEEILLPLYRKWNLYSAMTHDITFCCQNAFWNQKGENVLKHTISELGIALDEVHKSFDSLPSSRRKEIFDILNKYLDSKFVTFFAQYGYHQKFTAVDFARIMASKLELKLATANHDLIKRVESAKKLLTTFFENNGHDTSIPPAIALYQKGLDAVRGLVFHALLHSQVTAAAENFYVLTLDSSQDIIYLSSRHFLNMFVHFILTGFAISKNKKRSSKPIIFLIPSMTNDENRFWTITGAMPYIDMVRETERKSSLPIAFKKVTENQHIPITRDSFDPNILQIRHEDKVKFVEHLDVMLENFN
uniref:Uncharacterized protein n=1 Tax=Panagrolaimus superbus TaxID=310955 RepID=A0A914XTU9_9BILA